MAWSKKKKLSSYSCPKCGNKINPNDAVCPSCGANYRSSASATRSNQQQVAYVKELGPTHRPTGALAFSGLSIVGAISAFATGFSYKILPSISALASFASDFKALSGAMPYFLGVVGIISLCAAFGFLKGSRWAWKVGLLASILEIVTIISPNLIGLFVGIISLYFLSTKSVKSWLRK